MRLKHVGLAAQAHYCPWTGEACLVRESGPDMAGDGPSGSVSPAATRKRGWSDAAIRIVWAASYTLCLIFSLTQDILTLSWRLAPEKSTAEGCVWDARLWFLLFSLPLSCLSWTQGCYNYDILKSLAKYLLILLLGNLYFCCFSKFIYFHCFWSVQRQLAILLIIYQAACYWFSSVILFCPMLCNPMDCSTPGFPVHHQNLELAQTHVHWISNAIQPSHLCHSLLLLPLILPSIRVFSNESFLCIK